MIRTLEEVCLYKNDAVVNRFASDFKVTREEAAEIFLETKKWLYLLACPEPPDDGLLCEVRALDLMWHTFLLFTRDYAEFCQTHFGTFIHHGPRAEHEKKAWKEHTRQNREGALAERKALRRRAYEIVCDQLGTETLRKWSEEFPARFPFPL